MPRREQAYQQIRERTTEKILEAARTVFARKGTAATMAEVAAEAGVSQGLAYRYFPSKEAIFFTLARRTLQPADELRARVEEMRGTPGERLRHVITTMVERRRQSPEFYQFMYQAMMYEKLPEDLREAVNSQGAVAREIMRRLVVEGQGAGEIAKDDPDQLLGAIMACLEGLWSKVAFQHPDEARRDFPDAKIVLRMLRPDAEPKGGERR